MKALGQSWEQRDAPLPAVAAGLTAAAVLAALVAGLAALAVLLPEPAELHGWLHALERRPAEPRFSLDDVRVLQRNAALLGGLYLTLAAGLWWLGPGPLAGMLAELRAMVAGLGRVDRVHLAVLLAGMAAAAALAAGHLDQTMRADEATSFLDYGTRPVAVAVSWYNSTNNHVLHSVLMRLAVTLFGDASWSVRLPAAVAALLTVPAIYFTGRRLIGADAGLLAALACAGSGYFVDLATNARGYPMMIVAFLFALVTLPDVRRGNRGACAVFVLLMALGAWAVPLMVYPFTIALVWLAVRQWRAGEPWGPVLRQVSAMAVATGVLVGLLYSPALVTLGTQEPEFNRMLAQAQAVPASDRLTTLAVNLRNAWEMWTYPLPPPLALVTLLLGAGGALALLRGGGRAAALVVAVVLGTGATFIGSGLVPPPWWSLGFLFPPYLLLVVTPLAVLIRRAALARAATPALAVAICAALVWTTWQSYPAGFPNYVGYRDARAAAEHLLTADLLDRTILAGGVSANPVNYYLHRQGASPAAVRREPLAPVALPAELIYIDPHGQPRGAVFRALLEQQGMQLRWIHRLPGSSLIGYGRGPDQADTRYQ